MSRESKKRVDTSAAQQSLGFNPFSSLSSAGLPDNPLPDAPPAPAEKQPATKKGRVVLRKETAHRAGKAVIVVGDFEPHITDAEIEQLARDVKRKCGCGGAVKGREIEVQGDQPDRVRAMLQSAGFRVAGI